MSMIKITFEEYMLGRARMYKELSFLVGNPVQYDRVDFFEHITKDFLEITEDKTDRQALKDSMLAMREWLTSNKEKAENKDFINACAQEFTYHFRFGDDRVEDNASAALSKTKLIKRVQWEACKKFYTKCGFKLKATAHKLEDSLEVQFLFMENLIDKTLNTENNIEIDELLKLQVEFLDNHILNWLDSFSESLHAKAKEGSIYKALAGIPSVLTRIDRENITKLL